MNENAAAVAEHKNSRILMESEVKAILTENGINTTAYQVAESEDEAVYQAEELGYPVVLKVHSPAITHKSDIGGVALNLEGENHVRHAYQKILDKATLIDDDAKVVVQEMVRQGFDAIVGVKNDPHFGPVLLTGSGGVFTELLNDIAFGMIPVDRDHAQRMVHSLRAYPLLEGYRGKSKKDIEALIDVLMKISSLTEEVPEIVELDLNPVIVHEKGVTVVDARMVIRNQ